MATDFVAKTLAGAKDALEKANNLTRTVEGTPTSQVAAPEMPKHIEGVPSYKMAHEARKKGAEPMGGTTSEEINARQANIPPDLK